MTSEAERPFVRVGRLTILFFVLTFVAISTGFSRDAPSNSPQRCEDERKKRPAIQALCSDNNKSAGKRYRVRQEQSRYSGKQSPALISCAREAMETEESGGIADWIAVEDCLLGQSEDWVVAMQRAGKTFAIEAARYSCGKKAVADISYFDDCFYETVLEGNVRFSEKNKDDTAYSNWKVYRLCLSVETDGNDDDEELSLARTLEPLGSNLRHLFALAPRSGWRDQDEGKQCALQTVGTTPGYLYFPLLELCYRSSTNAEVSAQLESGVLRSHALSM